MAVATKAKNTGPKVVGTRTVRAEDVPQDELDRVAASAETSEYDADDDNVILAVCQIGAFQLHPEWLEIVNVNGMNRNRHHAGRMLDFGIDQRLVIDEETAELIDEMRAGRFDNGHVDPKHMQQLAISHGLQVIRPTLVGPPMPTWDNTPADRVVEVALAAGLLSTKADLENAVRYERQTPIRTKTDQKPLQARKSVLHLLDLELQKLAGPGGPVDDIDGASEDL